MSTLIEKCERYLKRREINSYRNERDLEKQREETRNRQMEMVKQFQQYVRLCIFLCDKTSRMVSAKMRLTTVGFSMSYKVIELWNQICSVLLYIQETIVTTAEVHQSPRPSSPVQYMTKTSEINEQLPIGRNSDKSENAKKLKIKDKVHKKS